jgi:hypothetical protein
MFAADEGGIDRDRIVDGENVPDEYFCPICRCLLWKPRSCSSCQHLFCQKCIHMWIENSVDGNICPFRCQTFEERRCPPYVQSILGRMNIHCRNVSFGCTEISSYDALELHETVECPYLSETCPACDRAVLVGKFDEHKKVPGICVPCRIKCTVCEKYVEMVIFTEHFNDCCEARSRELVLRETAVENFTSLLPGQQVTLNPVMIQVRTVERRVELIERQAQLSQLPTRLKGVDPVRRAREQNCGHICHVLIMLKFLLSNWSKISYLACIIWIYGLGSVVTLIIGVYTIFSHQAYKHIYCGPPFLVESAYLISYGSGMLLQAASDTTIILCGGILTFLIGCMNRASLELMEISWLFNRSVVSIVCYCFGVLATKLLLLLIRLFFWSFTLPIAAGLVTFLNLFVAFKMFLIREYMLTTMNPLLMPV